MNSRVHAGAVAALLGPAMAVAIICSLGAVQALALTPSRATAQAVERYGIITTSGADTVAVERVTRSATEWRSEMLVPPRARLSVVATLASGGCVTGAVVDVFPWGSGPDATALQHVSVQVDGDSVRVEARAREVVQQATLPFPGVEFVLAGDSWAASAMIVECGLSRGDSVTLHVAAFPGLRAQDFLVQRQGNRVTVASEQTSVATLDAAGIPVRIEVGGSDLIIRRVPLQELDAAEAAAPAPDYGPPPGAPYRAEDLSIPVTDGVILAGTLTLPAGTPGPVPALILVSGGGPQDRDSYAAVGGGWRPFRELAHALSSRGIAVLRFDDRGVGASTGDFASSTEREGLQDVQAALAALRGRSDIDGRRVALLGHSEGARVVMWAATEDPTVAGLILMAGAADPRGATRAQALWQLEHTPGVTPAARDAALARVDRQMDSLAAAGSREVFRWDAPALAAGVRAPVAILQGATDRQVPASQADSLGVLFRGAGNGDVTVRVFPDVNHLFVADPSGDFLRYDQLESGRLHPDVVEAVVEWIAARLGSVRDR
jgi:pimeloyl-ACP methyl ester carboxylesterase